MPPAAPVYVVGDEEMTISGLTAGRTYYWRVVSKTMAGLTRTGATRSFGT
jgi:hypothetical protein